MPVLMDDSRFLTTAAMASRCSGVILPVATRLLINSSIASQRLVARKSVMICALLRMSPKSIATESVRPAISPEVRDHFKLQLTPSAPHHPPQAMQGLAGAPKPPAERRHYPHFRDQQRDADQQYGDVAQEDNHG